MDVSEIKALIDAMAASGLAEMEVAKDGWTLRLVRGPGTAAAAQTPPAAAVEAPPAQAPDRSVVLAPLSGAVHLSPAPGEPPFVAAGQGVAAGTALCVIEAMKVFNKVLAECSGTVAEVLVVSGDEVEAGQPLFRFA